MDRKLWLVIIVLTFFLVAPQVLRGIEYTAHWLTTNLIDPIQAQTFQDRDNAIDIRIGERFNREAEFDMAFRYESEEARVIFHGDEDRGRSGLSATANSGWVFVQEPGQACLRCGFPDVEISTVAPCGGMCGDIADVIAGIVSFAVDTLAFHHPDRQRSWNLYLVDLTGFAPAMHQEARVERKPECELCQGL